MNELLQSLSGAHGKLTTILTAIAAARIALKPFNTFMLAWFHRILTALESNPDPFIGELAARILQNRCYHLAAFLLDTAISVKLPTVNTLAIHKTSVPPVASVPSNNQNQTP